MFSIPAVGQNDAQKSIEEKIISLVKENNKVTGLKMAELLCVSKPTIERTLKAFNRIKCRFIKWLLLGNKRITFSTSDSIKGAFSNL